MKRENNKKFKKRKRNQNRSLTCRVLSMMFAIVLFCSTVLINTDYVSQASSFDDMVDMVEVEEDSAAADTSEDTGDDLDTDRLLYLRMYQLLRNPKIQETISTQM